MIIRREGKTIFQKYGKDSLILLFSTFVLTYENTLYHSYTPFGNVCGSVLKN